VKTDGVASKADRGGARHPIVELTLARLREFVREPEALFWAFVFPIVMSLALAVAFPSGANRPVLVGLAPGEASAPLRQALGSADGITLREVPAGGELRALREGEVHVIVVPSDPPTYRFDPDRDESRTARLVVDRVLKAHAGREEPWTAQEDPVRIAGSRYVDWLIPGIIGLNVMFTGLWGIGFSIVQARMRKLLKRLVASPMRRSEYLMAQVLARMLFLAPEVAIPLAFGVFALGMPINGSIAAIAVVSVVGALAFGSMGLLVASRAKTFEAISGLVNMATLPMWLLSGVFFSASNFPDVAQPFIQALPLTALIDALRGVVLEGADVRGVGGELLLLTAWTIVPFSLALYLFKWR
jgi:ABC-type multidrug transport system permease subunit